MGQTALRLLVKLTTSLILIAALGIPWHDCCAPFFGQNRQHGAGSPGFSAGDGIVCGYAIDPTGLSTVTITDSLNSATFQHATLITNFGDGIASDVEIEYTLNSLSGNTDTITLSSPSSTAGYGTMSCEFVKNMATSSALDQNDNGTLTTSTNPTTASQTTVANGEFIYGYLIMASVTPTAGNGTIIDSNTFISSPEYRIQSTSGPAAMTWTAASDSWAAQLATFKSNGGTIVIDGACHNQHLLSTSTTIVVTISC